MALNRELTEQEIAALEAFLDIDCPSVLPPDLKIVAITLQEAGLVRREGNKITVTEDAKKLVEDSKNPFKLKRS
jgi:hypothetical protein